MSESISSNDIHEWRASYEAKPKNILATNAICNTDLLSVMTNRQGAIDAAINQFETRMRYDEAKVTSQKSTGRCWIFAALNVIRLKLIEKYKLGDSFELSQSYVFFYDKFERANYFLESMVKTANEPVDSRIVAHLLHVPLQDGGQYDMIKNVVSKYGLVPKTIMPETKYSCDSRPMNQLINNKLREYGARLRDLCATESEAAARKAKGPMLEEIYRILCIFLGPPPTTFDWKFRDKDKNFQKFLGLTPLSFLKEHVPFDVSKMVSLINDPRNEYYKLYSVEYLGNVVEGSSVRYVNLPIELLKKYAAATIKSGEPVWFGCDVGKFFHRTLHCMDMNLLDYKLVFDIDFSMNKKDRLIYGQSLMTHAMVFNAYDGDDECPSKWRVENSWSDTNNKGFATMSNEWFDEWMYQIVVDIDMLPDDIRKVLEQEPHVLPAWDPMGALAE